MEFGREQCAMRVTKSGKQNMIDGMELPNKKKN